MTTEIERALNFTSRYVLDLDFKNQGHFELKFIVQMETPKIISESVITQLFFLHCQNMGFPFVKSIWQWNDLDLWP